MSSTCFVAIVSHKILCPFRSRSAQQPSGTTFVYADGDLVVDIDPLPGRLIVFLSGAIDHAVLPSHQPRVALTAWCC